MKPEIGLKRPFIIQRSSFIVRVGLGTAILLVAAQGGAALACPFCLAIEPTLAQRRASADGVALGEAAARRDDGKSQTFQLHKVFKGPADLQGRTSVVIESPPAKTGALALLFATADAGTERADRWDWSTAFANEALLGYFAAAPDLREPPAKRLTYFLRHLEHADRDIARDAFLEFAHAPYEDVLAVADQFNFAEVRRWLSSTGVPDERKGFYALVLSMAKREPDRMANVALLERLIAEERSDFRAGFDGLLAAYLLLRGDEALKRIETRYLASERAKHGDVRHAASALRFYYEYGPKELRDDVAHAVARLIERPEFAAAAITDLARWEHWQVIEQVAALYGREQFSDGPTRRAVVGYLKASSEPEAAAALDRLRKRDPKGVEAVEKAIFLPVGK